RREDKSALLFLCKVAVLERRHEELERVNDEPNAVVLARDRPVWIINAVANNLLLQIAVIKHLPQAHEAVGAVTCDRSKALRIELDANAIPVLGIPAPLAEQIVLFAEAADVHLIAASSSKARA